MTVDAIRFDYVGCFDDCRLASRIPITRSRSIRGYVIVLLICMIGASLASAVRTTDTLSAIAIWSFIDTGTFFSIAFAFSVWNALIARPKSLWIVLRAFPLESTFSFDESKIVASNSDRTFEHDWSAYERYIEVREGVLLIHKTKSTQFFAKSRIAGSYDAFVGLLRRKLPSTRYFDEKLAPTAFFKEQPSAS